MSPPRRTSAPLAGAASEHSSPLGARRALLSVANKTGIADLARALADLSYEIVSTGGTAAALRAAGVAVTDVAAVTQFPEIMDGRVKTLHPKIHGGLLARAGIDDALLASHGIGAIEVLAVNLYPFEETVARPDCTDAEAIENIDVGGPAMLRAAAKNHERVTVVVDPADYAYVLEHLRASGLTAAQRRALAAKAFAHTARYDAAICRYLRAHDAAPAPWPDPLIQSWQLVQPLRYGENPHQTAALYRESGARPGSITQAAQLQGKELSYNNLVDADAALEAVLAFSGVACVIVKHANPCGIAIAASPAAAYAAAHRCDPESAFGGVIALNRALDAATAEAIVTRQFAEVIVAPEISKTALPALARKPNIRVLEAGWPAPEPPYAPRAAWQIKTIAGGALLQERDLGRVDLAAAKVVTQRSPTEAELRDLKFAWTAVKFVKSNAIVYARDGATLGIGPGQPSRVMSAKIGALKAAAAGLPLASSVLASDAFFPFRDGIDAAAEHGVAAIVQPGGSMKDDEVIRAADSHGIAMIFTGMRHFRH